VYYYTPLLKAGPLANIKKEQMRILLLLLTLTLTSSIRAQPPTFDWAKSMGSTGADYGNSITTDASGNVYTTGLFQDTVDFDPGAGTFNLTSNGYSDIFIQKLDANGNFIWAKSMGSFSGDVPNSVAVDALGNVYTTGYFNGTVDFDPGPGVANLTSASISGNIFVQKLDTAGNYVWAKQMGGSGFCYGNSVALDASSNVYTIGNFDGTADFDPGAGTATLTSAGGLYDIFISKLDASGNYVWARRMGGTDIDVGNSIAVDASENVYTTGFFKLTVDFDPGGGIANLTAAGAQDVYIQKLDVSGNFVWVKQMGGIALDYGNSITLDASNNVYTVGIFSDVVDFDPNAGTVNLTSDGSYDTFVQKLDASGNYIWAKRMGGIGIVWGNSIVLDGAGSVYTTGKFTGTGDFDPGAATINLISAGAYDIYISKLDVNGNFIWATSMGSTGADDGQSITTDASGNIYTTGRFNNTVDFDPGAGTFNLTSNGSYDIFIQKLSQCAPSNGIDTKVACDSYTWPLNSTTYTSSTNTPTVTLTNAANCDSVVTLDLIITNSTAGTDTQTACDSFLWIDGNAYTASNNTATHTLTNAANCDSVVTLDLIITNSTAGTDIQSACDSYLWIDGNTYTVSNNSATHTLTNAAGCDSVVTLNLTINTVDSSVTQNGIILTADAAGAGYQWLDCDNSFSIISGETNQSFTTTANGNFAVEITLNGCVDTSACYSVTSVGIIENSFGNGLLIYPNPTGGNFSIDLGSNYQTVTITMTDVNGKVILSKTYNESQLLNLKLEEPAGVYLLTIDSGEKKTVIRLINE